MKFFWFYRSKIFDISIPRGGDENVQLVLDVGAICAEAGCALLLRLVYIAPALAKSGRERLPRAPATGS
jgi:hypothetical protein